jgi:hypothetical protein
VKNKLKEVGSRENSNEVTMFIPHVPLTVHNWTAPKPRTDPRIESIVLALDLISFLMVSLISFIRQVFDMVKVATYMMDSKMDQKFVKTVNLRITMK